MKLRDVIIIFCYGTLVYGNFWSYDEEDKHGPADWHKFFRDCGGDMQSPIAIWKDDLVLNSSLNGLRFDGYDKPWDNMEVKNNGHTIYLKIPKEDSLKLFDGGLPDWYELLQAHLHWGFGPKEGAEHLIGDEHHPLEVHFVHTRHAMDIEDALFEEDGIAVLGVIFELGNHNKDLQKILDVAEKLAFKESLERIKEPIRMDDLLPKNRSIFYRYFGSLTTPPCSEGVIWSVFPEHLQVSQDQLDHFRALFHTSFKEIEHKQMKRTWRPVQPLNTRKVYVRSIPESLPSRPPGSGTASDRNSSFYCYLILFISAFIVLFK